MSEALKKLETLSYRPAKFSRATLGMNSAVIKPAVRVSKAEPKCEHCKDTKQKSVKVGGIFEWQPCKYCQPNLKIIGEIEGLISQVNEKLEEISVGSYVKKRDIKRQALEDIDKFQRTTLHELRTAFKD